MLGGIETLAIKPLKAYSGSEKHATTLTGFRDVLKKASASEQNACCGQAVSKENTEKTDDSVEADGAIVYTNPATGKKIIYVDVAAEQDSGKTGKGSAGAAVNGKDVTTAASMKKTKYDSIFKKAAKKYNISESLLKGIAMAESNFNPNCTSSSGAMGVMQLMPETAKGLGVKNPYDPEQNIMGGAKCIAAKLKEFNGNVRLALAAYNAGSGAVRRYGGIPSQCKKYVQRVLSFKKGFETASAVG